MIVNNGIMGERDKEASDWSLRIRKYCNYIRPTPQEIFMYSELA